MFDHFNNLYDLSKEDWTFNVSTLLLGACMLAAVQSSEIHVTGCDVWLTQGFFCCFRQKHKQRLFATSNSQQQQQQQQARPVPTHTASGRTLSARLQAAAATRFRYTEDTQESLNENGPVVDVSNTGDAMYMNSWIAEVTIVHPMGDIIRKYRQQQRRWDKVRASIFS